MRWLRRPGPPKNETGAQLQGLTATNISVLLLCRGCRWRRCRRCQQLRQCLSSKKSRVMGQGQKGKNNKKKGEKKKKNNSRVSNAPTTTHRQPRANNNSSSSNNDNNSSSSNNNNNNARRTSACEPSCPSPQRPAKKKYDRRSLLFVWYMCLLLVHGHHFFHPAKMKKEVCEKAGSGKERRTQQAARVKHGSK